MAGSRRRFIFGSRADSTNRSYRSMLGDWARYAARCHCPAVAHLEECPRLLRTIRRFAAHRGAKGQNADRHLSASRFAHLRRGPRDPSCKSVDIRARMAAEGIARSLELARGAKKAAPATVETLAEMQAVYRERKGTAGPAAGALAAGALAALVAAVVTCAGCLRLGAAVPESPARFLAQRHWRMRDLTLSKGQATACLRSPKTEVTTASRLTFEATGSDLCPVRLLRMVARRNRNQDPDAPLFQRDNGSTVVKRDVQRALSAAAARRGRPAAEVERLTGHSFRVGMVRALLSAGYDSTYVQHCGRWKSESTFREYLRQEFHELVQPAPGRNGPDKRCPLVTVGL